MVPQKLVMLRHYSRATMRRHRRIRLLVKGLSTQGTLKTLATMIRLLALIKYKRRNRGSRTV